ncbi:mannose-6-phosphate isomerase, class I [Agromyces aerolatus]|uniref:mannose-6-phosphate isomerase, class I n=1 Tax=Agromyces sp. LY-1074 TaxID=3074080 RepID=UPI00286619B8|nr:MULTISPECIES: mannose-6-phosphate isomerase, class I [unclassified Agromyces]MDR5700391.1 mannose-6-phosphate isomerase, class I [Agromyces sp. LY-1074]MDR5706631.1 mannose-6-phosphate isomerase, class I [Agromyces sp. LY-1358]
MFVAIRNTPRDYAWGSSEHIAAFRGTRPSGGPEAELWLGAHAGSPARIDDPAATGGARDLAEWIAAEPERALGPDLAAQGARLPFLLKLLAAGGPLSLQAHPTPEQARAGFAREEADGVPIDAYDRNYKDTFHKPELIVALSETFDALSGFRPVEEVRGVLATLREADAADAQPEPGALDLLESHLADGLAGTVDWLLRDGRGGDTGEAAWVVERVVRLAVSDVARASGFALSFDTVAALAEAYPGDPGIVISLLLNRVRLVRGEALYLRAGNIHAYLDGLGIELMASSDNVLRGGLTPKHIDVGELLEVLDVSPMPPPRLAPEVASDGVLTFRPDVPDFVLHRAEPGADVSRVTLGGPAIVLAERDEVRLAGALGETAVPRGAAVYVTPDEGALSVSGPGIAWVATTG